MDIAGRLVRPPFDAREEPLDAGPIQPDEIGVRALLRFPRLRDLPEEAISHQQGNQVLGAGEDAYVRLLGVTVAGEALVGLARDGREGHVPAQAEGAVACAGVVEQGELRRGAQAARRERERDGVRRGSRGGIDGELLVDPPNRPASLGQRGGGRARLRITPGRPLLNARCHSPS